MSSRLVVSLGAFLFLAAASVASPEELPQTFETWPQRAQLLDSYKRLPAKKITDDIKLQTMHWLSADADASRTQFETTGEGAGEAFGEYFIDLALFVVKLKDPRSIDALVKAMDVAGSVATTLAEFGDAAVEPVIASAGDPYLKSDAAYTLGKFIQGKKLGKCRISSSSEQRIRGTLLRLAGDNASNVRARAVEAIGYLKPDHELLKLVRGLASIDPANRKTDHGVIYPVRRSARKVLEAWSVK